MVDESELREYLQEYEDTNSASHLMEFLKEELIQKLEDFPTESEHKKHDLNMIIREIEEELDWIENDKLAEFDPEQQ